MTQNICCLGIESTAHTFGASVIKDKKILSNVKDSFTTEAGGMIPYQVADHHVEVCDEIIKKALSEAGVNASDIELVAFSQSPGLGAMLRIGAMAARSFAVKYKLPIIGVNHCIAHLEIGRLLTDAKDPILLYASGANTQIIAYDAGKYRVFGETLDMGIGNFLDQLAREFGLGFPGGPKIGMLAQEYREECEKNKKEPEYLELPYNVKGMDLAFAGIFTYVKDKLKDKYPMNQIFYSVEETIYAMLNEVCERALAHCGKTEVLLGGGVACAPRLQKMTQVMCEDRDAKCYVLENQFNVDNAAMIAWLGILMYSSGVRHKVSDMRIDAYLRTDEVEVIWR